ncbi:MAG: cupin domain-containing protein [Ignavibacteria bacterium]
MAGNISPAMKSAAYWKEKLILNPHPEGGYFKETYRAQEVFHKEHLPQRFSGDRVHSTGIYYLLSDQDVSKFHRIKSDEMWHFYDGVGVTIYEIDVNGNFKAHKLGLNIDDGELPQVLIKGGNWFGAKVSKPDSYCLCGCTVSPGFHFEDFEMADRENLMQMFPEHRNIIEELT